MYTKLIALLLFVSRTILIGSSLASAGESGNLTRQWFILPPGYVKFPDVNVAYKIYSQSILWADARHFCTMEGGNLAIADTIKKIQHINSLKSPQAVGVWLHVGIYKPKTTNKWSRVDNDFPLKSIPWASQEPHGKGACAGISFLEDGLVNYQCGIAREPLVCEIPL